MKSLTLTSCPCVRIEDVTVAYGDRPALWDIDLEIPQGTLSAVVGPNGAGKTTLMKTILGLISPVAGSVEIFGKSIADSAGQIAFVPQRGSVDWDFPISVKEVVMMGRYSKLGLFKKPREADHLIVQECLRKVEMEKFADRQISRLSGGQQQRVFMARAIAQDTDFYLMDEPFSGVDAATEITLLEVLKQMRDNGKTIIVVHHDVQAVAEHFDNALLLNLRKTAMGSVKEVLTEQNLQQTYGGKLQILSDVGHLLSIEQKKTRLR